MKILLMLIKDEKGQGLVEYGLIISLVVLAAIAAVAAFGGSVLGLYEYINTDMEKNLP